MGFHSLLQGIFPTQRSNPCLPHCEKILYHLSHQGFPILQIVGDSWELYLTTFELWHQFFSAFGLWLKLQLFLTLQSVGFRSKSFVVSSLGSQAFRLGLELHHQLASSLRNWGCHLSASIITWELPWWLTGKESACQAGVTGSISGLDRSPEERTGDPLQYSCLKNSSDRETWQATIHGVTESDMTEKLTFSLSQIVKLWS